MGFAGAATTDSRVRVDVLTPALPLSWHLRGDPMIKKAARTFAAFKQAVNSLDTSYTRQAQDTNDLPYPSSYTSAVAPHHSVKLELTRRLENDKLIFQANDAGADGSSYPVFVKFTRKYSRSLHEICAKNGHAPALLGYDELPGGWIMVVMEHLEHSMFTLLCSVEEEERREIGGQLRAAVQAIVDAIHAEGHVHGDFRDTILLVSQSDSGALAVRLVDFDWGGKTGEARYPMLVNHVEVERPADAVDGALITEAHDLFILEKIFTEEANGHIQRSFFSPSASI